MFTEHAGAKLVITGPPGAGKTTAIAQISEITPIVTEVLATDLLAQEKEQTTVGLDFGQITLNDGETVALYGTPGQGRFSFMWDILLQGAQGVIILINHARPDPLADLREFAQAFSEHLRSGRAVLGISRHTEAVRPSLDDYAEALTAAGCPAPVLAVDVRVRDDVLLLVESLALMGERHAEDRLIAG